MSASFTPRPAAFSASRKTRARSASTSSRLILHPLPARLVDGGVGLPILVLVAFKAERIEHVLRRFDVLHGQDAAGMAPTLRRLPRRFEGGGRWGAVGGPP